MSYKIFHPSHPFNHFYCNSRRILIDTGDASVKAYCDALNEFLTTEKVEIDKILITHWHHDHVGGVQDVIQLEGAKNAEIWKYPRSDEEEKFDFPVKQLKDGQEFSVDDKDHLKVLYTPGHTTDHICLSLSTDRSLFSGDCILGETTAVFEDLFDYMQSLDKILVFRPSTIYPGHGKVVADPVDKIEYYIKHRQQREAQILAVLKAHPQQSFTELEIVAEIYVDTPKELYPAAAYNVNHHLGKLRKEHQVILVESSEDGANKWKYSSEPVNKL